MIDAGPKVALEAMASGVPVIVTSNMGYSEIITDGKEGYIILPRNTDSIAHCPQQVYQDSERLEVMGLAARRTAEQFTPQAHGLKVLGYLRDLYREARTAREGSERVA